jgi:uncharacterized membrane protein YccC
MAAIGSSYRSELRLVARAVTAAALSLLVGDALALPQSYWAVITALIVVQGSLGGTLTAGLDRLVGTLAGAALGVAAAVAGNAWSANHVLLLVLTVAPLALLAAVRPSFRVAPITAAIVLLANPGGGSPVASALHRVGEIALGTIIGIVVSLVVFPSRARRICFERSAETLTLLGRLSMLHLRAPDAGKTMAIERLNEQVRAALTKVATAAKEAEREHVARITGEPVPARLVRTLRRLRSDIAFVGRATAADDLDWTGLGPLLGETASACGAAFDGLSASVLTGKPVPPLDALDTLDAAIAKLRTAIDDAAGPVPRAGASALPFVMETLRRDLGDLADGLAAVSGEPAR